MSSTLQIRDLHEEITSRGHRHHAEVHVARQEAATEAVAHKLGLAVGAPVFHTLIVHFEDGVPLQCEDRHVNPASAPDYLQADFKHITPTQYLLQVAPFWEAQYSIEAALPTAREARLLGIRREDPCLVVARRTVGQDVPITHRTIGAPGHALPAAGTIQAMTMQVEQRMRDKLTPELVRSFSRDGAVCVRQLLSPDEVALLREGIDANLATPSPRAKVASTRGDPGFFIEDFCNWPHNAAYRRVIFESPLAAVAGALTGSRTIRLYHDHMLTKEPGTRAPTPWHQDQPYYNIEGEQNVSIWIAVDPVRRHSTLEFVAGSHRGPWLMPRSFMDQQAKWFPEGSLADLPDIEVRAQRARHHRLGDRARRRGLLPHAGAACGRCGGR